MCLIFPGTLIVSKLVALCVLSAAALPVVGSCPHINTDPSIVTTAVLSGPQLTVSRFSGHVAGLGTFRISKTAVVEPWPSFPFLDVSVPQVKRSPP